MKPPLSLRSGIPLTVRVPLVVVLLMVVISIGVSQLVLWRLVETQERQLGDLANAYLDGLESSLVDPVLRRDSWEVFDILDRARAVYAAVRPIETTVADANGLVLASSEPRSAPIGSTLPPSTASRTMIVSERDGVAIADRSLMVEGRQIGRINTRIDISPMLAERAEVTWYLVISNAVLTIALTALGWFTVRRMVAPMNVLLRHVSAAADGSVEPIPETQIRSQSPEWSRLFQRYNRMANALSERELLLGRVAEEERLAGLGKLASSVAHEINNPLGGILNAVDTIRVHGDNPKVRAGAVELVDRGLRGMRDIVRSILNSYKEERPARGLTHADFDDLLTLITPEVRRKQIALEWTIDIPEGMTVSALGIRQAALNLLLNACKATPRGSKLGFSAGIVGRALELEISDAGPGLATDVAEILTGDEVSAQGVATSGLGLWVTRRIVKDLGGSVVVGKSKHGGAKLRVIVPLVESVSREVADVA